TSGSRLLSRHRSAASCSHPLVLRVVPVGAWSGKVRSIIVGETREASFPGPMEVPPYPRLRFAPPAVPSPTSWGTDPFKISWRERLPSTRRLRRRVPSPFAIAQGDKPPPAFSRDRK